MLKRLLGLILLASIACAGTAHAQSLTAPAIPGGIAATKPGGAVERWSETVTIGELTAIGVGIVAGVVVFEAVAWDGLGIVGAVVGGWAGDYYYHVHTGTVHAS